jgi:hypothetical protein
MSERKMISVHNAVIAIILVSCLEQTVDMFKELQFCTANVRSGKLLVFIPNLLRSVGAAGRSGGAAALESANLHAR